MLRAWASNWWCLCMQDDGFDKCGLADEAKRVAQNLAAAAAAGGFGTTPFPSKAEHAHLQLITYLYACPV